MCVWKLLVQTTSEAQLFHVDWSIVSEMNNLYHNLDIYNKIYVSYGHDS